MKVIEPGRVYELLDGRRIGFVDREPGTEHEDAQTREVLRANIDSLSVLIDRTNHCDARLRWEGSDRIIKALSEAQRQLRLALLFQEQRALERETKAAPKAEVPAAEDGHQNPMAPPRGRHRWPAEPRERPPIIIHWDANKGGCAKCGEVYAPTPEERDKYGPTKWTRYYEEWRDPPAGYRRCTDENDARYR